MTTAPKWTEQSKRQFDSLMAAEHFWMLREYDSVEERDYQHADFCHQQRRKCMAAAAAALVSVATHASSTARRAGRMLSARAAAWRVMSRFLL